MGILDIAEVKKHSGLTAATIRYYEEKGLIKSVGRQGLRRQFSSEVITRLGFIALARSAGFKLDEINTMLTDAGPVIDRGQLLNKADEIDQLIIQLGKIKQGLIRAANCSAPSYLECKTFSHLLEQANLDNISKRKK